MINNDTIRNCLNIIYQKYGYDFREYSEAHVRRRINHRMSVKGIKEMIEMEHLIQNDESIGRELINDLSITVTEMFRDPGFYLALRKKIIPILKTYPFIKIWHAGCSTGEEVYSMAILLTEENIYERCTIYATDFNQSALNHSREGIYSNSLIKEYTQNYQLAGGKESFSSYYTSSYGNAIMNQSLKKNIVWAHHNLVTDSVFSEIHLVICRNVLIYFERDLQNKVLRLFHDSLVNGGILGLGSKESLSFTDLNENYINMDIKNRIYKKKY